ncbi:MAG TPA: paraquat-inducible protein A [Holophaga sp.]|nr:paraquat-inducible protein A [Holophaga sp.]
MATSELMACPECDLLYRLEPLAKGQTAVCRRCGAFLRKGATASLDAPLALACVALVLFALSNAFPLLVLQLHGAIKLATIPGCVQTLITLGWPWLAAILITTVVLAPPVYLAGLVYVLIQARRGRATPWTMRIFRIVQEFQPWGMTGVFLLGILVAYVKLKEMSVVMPGFSMYALAAFSISLAALATSLEPAAVWNALEREP